MKKYFVLALGLMVGQATASLAQPYYVRGDFNGWSTSHQLAQVSSTTYSVHVTGQSPNSQSEYKIATEDWAQNWPGSNGKIQFNASGEAIFYLHRAEPFGDGWNPIGESRVGYDNFNAHGWDIMGAFNGWSSPVVTLTHMGGGLYEGDYVVSSPGTYEFKFRKEGDWAISIGDNFGNSAANASVTTTMPDEAIRFQLDLPGGRWRVTEIPAVIPEPGTMLLVLIGAAALFAGRRQR